MIKLTSKYHNEDLFPTKIREWPKYSTQLLNLCNQNGKGTTPKNIGSLKELWTRMVSEGIRPSVENWFDYLQSRDQETDGLLYKGFTARSRLNVQFSNELSLRFVAQYDDFYETWDFDPLLTYRINPFTMFYIGTTYDYEKKHGLNQAGTAMAVDGDPIYDHNRLAARQFFMKLQYLFQV